MVLGSVLGARTFPQVSLRRRFPQNRLGITVGCSEWWGPGALRAPKCTQPRDPIDENLLAAFMAPLSSHGR